MSLKITEDNTVGRWSIKFRNRDDQIFRIMPSSHNGLRISDRIYITIFKAERENEKMITQSNHSWFDLLSLNNLIISIIINWPTWNWCILLSVNKYNCNL